MSQKAKFWCLVIGGFLAISAFSGNAAKPTRGTPECEAAQNARFYERHASKRATSANIREMTADLNSVCR